MRFLDRAGCAAALALPLLLAGCSLFPTTRHLPVPKAPAVVQTATPAQLVQHLDQRWNLVNTLTATAEITATETKTSEGVQKALTFRGFILMRKPKLLRIFGTYFGQAIFDMASDGSRFTLVMPTKNTAIEGSNTVTVRSPNPLENLRPDFFLDALVVRGLDPDDEYILTGDTVTVEDAAKKHLYLVPEYILSVVRRKPGSRELTMVRKVTFHRDDMLPYALEVYDDSGNLATQITYSNYAVFSAGKYPSKITINRPQEGIQLMLSVERVEENVNLPDSQFEAKIPDGIKIEQLK